VLKRQTPDKQKIAALFIDFFQKRIDLETLKTKLSAVKAKLRLVSFPRVASLPTVNDLFFLTIQTPALTVRSTQ